MGRSRKTHFCGWEQRPHYLVSRMKDPQRNYSSETGFQGHQTETHWMWSLRNYQVHRTGGTGLKVHKTNH